MKTSLIVTAALIVMLILHDYKSSSDFFIGMATGAAVLRWIVYWRIKKG